MHGYAVKEAIMSLHDSKLVWSCAETYHAMLKTYNLLIISSSGNQNAW